MAASSSNTTIGDNDRSHIKYQGKWTTVLNPPGFQFTSLTYTAQVGANATFTFTGQFVGVYGVIRTQPTPDTDLGTHCTCTFDDSTSEMFGDNNTLKPGMDVKFCSTTFSNDGVHTVMLTNHGSSLWLNYITYGPLSSPLSLPNSSASLSSAAPPALTTSLTSHTPSPDSVTSSKVVIASEVLSQTHPTAVPTMSTATPATLKASSFFTPVNPVLPSTIASALGSYNESNPIAQQSPSLSSGTSTSFSSTSSSTSGRDSTAVPVPTIVGATLGTLVFVLGIASVAWAWRARQRTRRLSNANAFARLDQGATPGQMLTGATETGTVNEKPEKRKKQMEKSRHTSGASSYAPTLPRYGYVYRESQILEGSDVVVRDERLF